MTPTIKVGELLAPRAPTINPARFPDEVFALYSIPAFDTGVHETLRGGDIGSTKQHVTPGDVLLSKIVPHIRRSWIVQAVGSSRLLASSEWIVFNSDRVDPRYLSLIFISDKFHREFMTTVGGVGGSLLRAQRDQVAQIDIPLPSIDEQRSIADVLESIRSSMTLESKAIAVAERLKADLMREVFSRGMRGEAQKETSIGPIPHSWSVVELGEIARIGSGSTPNRKTERYWNGNIPYVTSAKMYSRDIITADEFVTEEALTDYHLPRLQPGTILMAIVGEGKTLGHCAVLEIEATVSRHVGYLILDQSRVRASFFRQYLEMRYDYLRTLASGNGSTRGALTAGILKRMPLPVPSPKEQDEIAVALDAVDRKIELHRRKRTIIEQLFKALLNGLMAGNFRVPNLGLNTLNTPLVVTAKHAEEAMV